MKKILTTLVAAVFVAATALPSSAAVTITKLPQHPSIASQSTEWGKRITDIGVQGSTLYLGYGDYSSNTGPIDVATVTTSGVAGIAYNDVPTEALATYRNIGGKLYAPLTDPKAGWTTLAPMVVNNATGTWQLSMQTRGQHFYDIARTGNGHLVLVGSYSLADGSEGGAAAYVSKDGGNTWTLGVSDVNTPATGFERYYWAAEAGGKVYIKAHNNGSKFPLRVYDGVSWKTASSPSTTTLATLGHEVESYKGKIYSTRGHWISGGRINSQWLSGVSDFFQYNGYLYSVKTNGEISRHDGTISKGKRKVPVWRVVSPALNVSGESFTSIAIVSGAPYLGTNLGNVYRVNGATL